MATDSPAAGGAAPPPPPPPPAAGARKKPLKVGVLCKLGGGGGGHKNWKDRYFVLTDHLEYYSDQAAYEKGKEALGSVSLNSFYCGVDTNYEEPHGLQLIAYPKSLFARATSDQERDEWIAAIMKPLHDLRAEMAEFEAAAAAKSSS